MYATVEETALKWNISERSVRNYCAQNRVRGAVRDGEGWRIPTDATKPARKGTGVMPVEHIRLKPIARGNYTFAELINLDSFYMDKTNFIGQWWRSPYKEMCLLRPRGYGKSLMLSMVDEFFSVQKQNRGLFGKLCIHNDEEIMELQGTIPTVLVDFSSMLCNNAQSAINNLQYIIRDLYRKHEEVLQGDRLSAYEKKYFLKIINSEENVDYTVSIKLLCECVYKHYGSKPLLLVDGYDTAVIAAKRHNYWDEVGHFMHSIALQSIKANQFYERVLMTGVSRACKNVLGVEMGNVKMLDIYDNEFAGYIGFTESEVQNALSLYGMEAFKESVGLWYAGRSLPNKERLYNSYTIINLLDEKRLRPCWNNIASVKAVGKALRLSSVAIKDDLKRLLDGKSIKFSSMASLDQNNYLGNREAFWELLQDYGYIKRIDNNDGTYEFVIANKSIYETLCIMIKCWLNTNGESSMEMFIDAMLTDDVYSMNGFLGDMFSQKLKDFATGPDDTKYATERFYHILVLGMMLNLKDSYEVRTNPRSGYGRYDAILVPKDKTKDAVLLEFKQFNPMLEDTMASSAKAALEQLTRKGYAEALEIEGISKERIKKYGIVFNGLQVLVDGN